MKHKRQLKQIGQRIREARIKKGLTLQALADDAEINISSVKRIESGSQNVSLSVLYSIAEALDIAITNLVED